MLPIKKKVPGIASSLTTLAYNVALEGIIIIFLLLNISCSSQQSPLKPMYCLGLEKLKAKERRTAEVLFVYGP